MLDDDKRNAGGCKSSIPGSGTGSCTTLGISLFGRHRRQDNTVRKVDSCYVQFRKEAWHGHLQLACEACTYLGILRYGLWFARTG